MPINTNINLKVVGGVAEALGVLRQDMLFVGGAVSSLYADDPVATEPRPTKDIDISVKIASYAEMSKLSEKLAKKGFLPATESSVMYRYKFKDVFVDFIPFEPTALGPTNSWLKVGFRVANSYNFNGIKINILPVAYYLATKWEAFLSRGKNDPLSSHDLEDFIYVLDYHLEIVDAVKTSDKKVQDYQQEAIRYILHQKNRDEFIEAQLIPSIATARRKMIIEKMENIIAN